MPPIPFPRRLRKEKEEAQQKKFLENLKQLHINLSFIEAIAQMPKYAKFLKGLLTNRARLEEACTITMNERCLKRSPAKDDECYGVDDLDDAINAKAQDLLANDTSDSFLLKGLEKSVDQSDLESCESSECKVVDDSDSEEPIRLSNLSIRRIQLRRRHKISEAGIEVDRAKIDVIAKLPYPTNVKGVRSFLGYAGFYQRFIKDFSMISKPLNQLLMKDVKFDFSDDCKEAFNILKEKLTTAPIIISPHWNVPFELMCDASDFDVGAVLGQRIDGKFKPVYYASKTLYHAQEYYTTTEKELLVVFFSFDKFRPYLILSKTVVYM
ncbi:reverse transcriptase domain-containing protein [Tanacetum coccineum]